ncbi:MAG: GGDEF domain-containing protein [Azoarcus sp. PHD]|nr:MAG: GGDEF domain-containing protein [Azoarcus sp. PHD]
MSGASAEPAAVQPAVTHSDARVLAHEVIEFLIVHALHPSPINYAVGYEYRIGGDAALNARIDAHLAADKRLDDLLMRELYDEHLAIEQFRNLRGLGGSLQELVDGLIGDISEAGKHTSGFHSTVENNISLLKRRNDSEAVTAIAADLLAATAKVHSSNATLKARLDSADQEARKLRDELERHRREALSDPLTGLLNRRGMEYHLDELAVSGAREPLSVVVLDIDHFKRINDTYGHAVGDVVIRHVAKVMRTAVCAEDVTVRFGGEEFVILMPRRSLEEAEALAESIRVKVERLRLIRRQDKLALDPFTVSLGVASRHDDEAFDGIFERADKALYAAKNSGRNRVLTELALD